MTPLPTIPTSVDQYRLAQSLARLADARHCDVVLKELERLHHVALVACMDVEPDDEYKELAHAAAFGLLRGSPFHCGY